MGQYGAYIVPAYAISALVIASLVAAKAIAYRRLRAAIADLEKAGVKRRSQSRTHAQNR